MLRKCKFSRYLFGALHTTGDYASLLLLSSSMQTSTVTCVFVAEWTRAGVWSIIIVILQARCMITPSSSSTMHVIHCTCPPKWCTISWTSLLALSSTTSSSWSAARCCGGSCAYATALRWSDPVVSQLPTELNSNWNLSTNKPQLNMSLGMRGRGGQPFSRIPAETPAHAEGYV